MKSLTYESSTGISQASVVANDEQLAKRVQFIHDTIVTPAIVEEFIDGRELYVGVMGNERLQVFPVWEMSFAKMPENNWQIATERVKWSVKYQKKHGIDTALAGLPAEESAQGAAPRQARLPGARPDRLRAYRSAHEARRAAVRDRGQPQPAARAGRGLRRIGAPRRTSRTPKLIERIISLGLQWQPSRMALGKERINGVNVRCTKNLGTERTMPWTGPHLEPVRGPHERME